MRRGFKAWCERVSDQYRRALGVPLQAPLDPTILARHLGAVVWTPADVPGLSDKCLKQLTLEDRDSWSAVTLGVGDGNVIIVNSSHAATRQRNSLTHELAHLILDHEPGRIDVSKKGYLLLSSYEKEQEDEADWLSASLLVPREGLRRAYRSSQDPHVLAARFGVSTKLLQWRLRMTGILVQTRRARGHRYRPASVAHVGK